MDTLAAGVLLVLAGILAYVFGDGVVDTVGIVLVTVGVLCLVFALFRGRTRL